MNRAVMIRCVICGLEVVGVLDLMGRLKASDRSRPDIAAEPINGYCALHMTLSEVPA